MQRHWKIIGSGDYELLIEHAHRERRIALALKQRIDAAAVPIDLVEPVVARIARHMEAYQTIMRAAGLWEASTPLRPLIVDRATWKVVAA